MSGYYNICPLCGAYLDPGEKCDCEKEYNEYIKRVRKMVKVPDAEGGQIEFKYEGGSKYGQWRNGW